MEKWSIGSYKKPFLNIGYFSPDEAGASIEIGEHHSEFSLTSESLDALDNTLKSLGTCDSEHWIALKQNTSERPLQDIVAILDDAGLIREAAPEHTLAKKQGLLNDTLEEAYAALAKQGFNQQLIVQELLESIQASSPVPVTALYNSSSNIYLIYARLALDSWKVICPPAVPAAAALLKRLAGQRVETTDIEFSAFWVGEVRKCLSALTWLLVRSQQQDAEKLCSSVLPATDVDSGLNLAIRLERWGLEFLGEQDASRYRSAFSEDNDRCDALIAASYAQEYYITDRFIDLICPAISQRLPRPLKKLARRYYMEEAGHELYELKTCKSLGMSEADLHTALPTPYAQLLCDFYTYFATTDVVSYFAAATITEGLPGQENLLNSLSTQFNKTAVFNNRPSRKHEQLNEKLAHQYISRIMLSEVGELSTQQQQTTATAYALLLELTHRAWEELHRLHVLNKRPPLNFAMSDFL
ncbi:hypothetical protein [Pseudomonas syringae]|uniref:hypothetical protein n=1 Tax=Pseudomonas syringae TaxID=317 RepID=UPI00040F5262|nr:hypothetical protein [Pseudomonas syringae]KTB87675.1 hypothetical protein AO070_18690 [Pseudomonas syringae pv. syringae PD2766]